YIDLAARLGREVFRESDSATPVAPLPPCPEDHAVPRAASAPWQPKRDAEKHSPGRAVLDARAGMPPRAGAGAHGTPAAGERASRGSGDRPPATRLRSDRSYIRSHRRGWTATTLPALSR